MDSAYDCRARAQVVNNVLGNPRTRIVVMDFTIECMQPSDWQQVQQIYLEGLATRQASFEVKAPTWEHWDAGHLAHSRLVARNHRAVIGWAALAPQSRRECYAGVAEVSLYVAAAHRGLGVGKALLLALIDSSERQGIWTLCGGTFPENAASVQLQLACGFRVVGRRERIAQHHGVWRDTILTERRSQVVGLAAR
jgi:L-amino acid N-acyltransferase YncA